MAPGQILLQYAFDPVSILRVMYLDGHEAPAVPPVRKLVMRLPKLTEPQVLAGLDSSDDAICLRAIQATAISTLVGLPDY